MRKLLLASTILALGAGVAHAQSCPAAPGPAAAAGYNTQTFASTPTLGGAWKPFNFFGNNPSSVGAVQNPNGSVTITGGGNNYNAQISTASASPSGWTGEAFGGGGYFSATMAIAGKPGSMSGGWPSFWANTIESMAGGKRNLNNEVDVMEMDNGASSYGTAIHDWGVGNSVSTHNATVSIPPGADLSQPHTYGMLWTPATETTQGSMQWFFDGKPVGTADHWDKYNPSQSPAANPYAALDSSHLALLLGTGPDNPITISDVQVWQASSVDNLADGGPSAKNISFCRSQTQAAVIHESPPVSVAVPAASGATAAPCGAVANGAASGGFTTKDGNIYDPSGKPFVAKGINVSQKQEPSVDTLHALVPGLNFVRYVVFDLSNPSSLTAWVNSVTSAGIVVEIEHHVGSGGGVPPLSGGGLAQENMWFGWLAATFKSNPNVWFGTLNEPDDTGGNGGVLANEQASNYQTIRGAGNGSMILLSAGLGPPPVSTSGMTNVAVDQHYYGWVSGYSTDQAKVNDALAKLISADQQLTTATGKIPLLIGEYGNSTTGATIDTNGDQVIAAVQSSGYGSSAWAWGTGAPGDGLLNSDGSLSAYGQKVAGYIALVASAPASVWACSGQSAAASAKTLVAQAGTTAAAIQAADKNQSAPPAEIPASVIASVQAARKGMDDADAAIAAADALAQSTPMAARVQQADNLGAQADALLAAAMKAMGH